MRSIAALLLLSVSTMPARAQTFIDQYKTVLPHVVFGGGWHNKFVVANYNSVTASVRLHFYGEDGRPLSVPIKQFGTDSVVDVILGATDVRVIETDESPGDSLHQGWVEAEVLCMYSSTCKDVAVYGIFSTAEVPGHPVFDATVFASDSRSEAVVIPYDNRNGFSTGIALVARVCAAAFVTLQVSLYPTNANRTSFLLAMNCPGHMSASLPDWVTSTRNTMGLFNVFPVSRGAKVSAIGLLFDPRGGAHTTIPASESIP